MKDRYNWYIIYITNGIYFCFYCRRSRYLYILHNVCFYFTRQKFYCCYSCSSVKVLEIPGILSKVLEKSRDFDAKSPGKREKKSWKVLEFESIFLVGTMSLLKICFLSFIEDCHKSFDASCNLFNYQSIHLYCCYCRY